MLRGWGRLMEKSKLLCSLPIQLQGATTSSCNFSVRQHCPTEELRDFGIPNETWSQNLKDLYNKFTELSKNGIWKRIPSYNTFAHLLKGDPLETRKGKRMFLKNLDSDGLGFEYCMFYNKDERRMVCFFQPGPYLEGPPGYAHGGSIAAIIDSTAGAAAVYTCGSIMTANLNITYYKPIPLGCTLFVDSHVDKIEGRKVYLICHIQSHDRVILHAEATGLFITTN
ncbi:acyl-coenzyme A thioesterase THEM4-like isoform 1-T3 [Anomaloglossus baeobatrachus]|uniref:acyl-coenzyme A thioesterase THEM4-like n=1 Tax=Anomaloglossus baeobatrachus TaxID=238106 RepID=UPI003F4F4AA3